MNISVVAGVRIGHLSDADVDRLLAEARAAAPTYNHIGSTLALHSDAKEYSDHVEVGAGERVFGAARTALRTWVAQRGIGADIIPDDQPVAPGATVLLVIRRGPFFIVAPDRVVAIVDDPRRYAFAYGTLPGHPERGEESFCADWLDDDRVRVTIRVQARASTISGRIGGPVVRRVQRGALRRYLSAIADFVVADGLSVAGSSSR